MKRFAKKLLLFSLPFLLLLVWFFAFEPYDWLGLRGERWYSCGAVSSKRELLREKPENLIFGDSRMANLNTDYIASIGGGDWLMMAYGGATLQENIEDFWYAARHTEMKRVVFGLSFYTLNDSHANDRHDAAVEFAENPFAFVGDFRHWYEAAQNCNVKLHDLLADCTGDDSLRIPLDDPSSLTADVRPPQEYGEDGRWVDLVKYSQIILVSVQNYSCVNACEQLDKIVDYCGQTGIELSFVLFPCHDVIWQEVIRPMGLQGQMMYYKDFLKSRAPVLDMEIQSDFSAEDDNFIDGFHPVLERKLQLCRIIFAGEEADFCVRTEPESYQAG